MQISSFFAPTTAPAPKPVGSAPASAKPSAEEEFLAYARKTPAEQMREKILNALGLTEEQVKAMDPKTREQVEAKIKEMIKAQIENDPRMRKGSFLDVQA